MKSRVFLWISLVILGLAFFYQLIRLPVLQGGVWMSPDETANAVSAMQFAKNLSFRLAWDMPAEFPWAHPRSFVPLISQSAIVPVGFLGMPIILSIFYKLFGLFGILFFTPLLVVATLYALYKSLPDKWPLAVKLICLALWISFPTVILYANRGTFAQLIIVCLAVWIWWLLNFRNPSPPPLSSFVELSSTSADRSRGNLSFKTLLVKGGYGWISVAGFLTGLVAIIRPIELFWVLPVAVYHFLPSVRRTASNVNVSTFKDVSMRFVWFIVPFVVVCVAGAVIGYKTYGQWFVSGYQVRTPAPVSVSQDARDARDERNARDVMNVRYVSISDVLPFDFHPRNILWNVKNYYGIYLWPFSFVLLLALGFWFYDNKKFKASFTKGGIEGRLKGNQRGIYALAWTAVFTLLFYGNGLYQDYFAPNRVSLGNSFLRYTLPVSLVLAISVAYVISKLWKHWSLKIVGTCLAIILIAFGQWTAIMRDDEGVAAAEREIVRYSAIRKQTLELGQNFDVVLSERSDKIFFPAIKAVSPLPEKLQIKQFLDSGKITGLFIRTQDQSGLSEWEGAGLHLKHQFTSGNESLYLVTSSK